MMSHPLVSVIVPTKNEEKNIIRCLKSIKKQKYSEKVEIIVVDNYSTDKTVGLAKKYTKKVFSKGPERSTQRNFGAQIAKGKYLLFIDADMELGPGIISECVSLVSHASQNLSPIIAIKEQSIGTTFWGKALALERNCYQNATWLLGVRFFSKEQFTKIGGYDTKLIAAEDWDITLRFVQKGFQILNTPVPLIFHHEPKESLLILLKKELYYIKNINRYRKKHPKAFFYQSSLLYRVLVWFKNWRALVKHPILTLAFLGYKFSVWIVWNIEQFNENR